MKQLLTILILLFCLRACKEKPKDASLSITAGACSDVVIPFTLSKIEDIYPLYSALKDTIRLLREENDSLNDCIYNIYFGGPYDMGRRGYWDTVPIIDKAGPYDWNDVSLKIGKDSLILEQEYDKHVRSGDNDTHDTLGPLLMAYTVSPADTLPYKIIRNFKILKAEPQYDTLKVMLLVCDTTGWPKEKVDLGDGTFRIDNPSTYWRYGYAVGQKRRSQINIGDFTTPYWGDVWSDLFYLQSDRKTKLADNIVVWQVKYLQP